MNELCIIFLDYKFKSLQLPIIFAKMMNYNSEAFNRIFMSRMPNFLVYIVIV